MKRYFIEEAKCGVVNYGPSGYVVTAVKLSVDGVAQWLYVVDVEGILNVVQTDTDIYDGLMEDNGDEEFNEYVNAHNIEEFEGIEFDGDYFTTFASMYDDPENPASPLIRYLLTLNACSMEEVDDLVKLAVGKYIDEVDIPLSDEEEEWLEEMAEEAEDEEDEEDD